MITLDALAATRVVYVGGVSGSGKSAFAATLATALPGSSLVKLDWIYNGLHAARTHGGVKRSRRVMARIAPAIVAAIVADALEAGDRVIIEGGWVEPRAWQRIAADDAVVQAFFLGYPDATVDGIVARLSATPHWLNSGIDTARSFIADQIKHSKRLQRKAAGPNVVFVDVSLGFVNPVQATAIL